MSDALPTISADQLTKAVSLAAAGTLSAVEAETENEAVGEWKTNDNTPETGKSDNRNPSLKCLETLSTSVSSNLGKLSHLNLNKQCVVYSPRNFKTNLKSNAKSETSPSTVKKYSSRKNYKLMPPLIPNEIRTNVKKIGPKMVQHQQLVTLSHCSNVHSLQDLKSVSVRPARYTTRYLFVRTAQTVPSVSGLSTTNMAVCPSSDAGKSSLPSAAAACATNVNSPASEPVVITATSGKLSVGTPILLPFSQVEQSSQSIQNMSVTLTPPNEIKHPPRILPSTKLQPLFRFPFPVNSICSNVVMKTIPVSKEDKVKETSGMNLANNKLLNGDCETAACTSHALVSQHILPLNGSSKPDINTVKHIVPVSTAACEIALLTSFTSPLIMTAKVAQSSTLTVNSRSSQPRSHATVSPQTVLMTSDPNHMASSSSSNIVNISSQVHIASPSIQLVTGNNAVKSLGASRLKSPIVFTHVTNSVGKQHSVTQASIVRITGKKSLKYSVPPTSKTHLASYKKPRFIGSNSVNDDISNFDTDVSLSEQCTIQSTPLERNNRVTSSIIVTPASTAQLLHLTKPVNIYSSQNCRPVTDIPMSTQRPDKEDVQKHSTFSRTVLSSPATTLPLSLYSDCNANLQERDVITSKISMPTISLVLPSSSSLTSETYTVSAESFQPNASSCGTKTTSTASVSHVPFQTPKSATGLQQQNVHIMSASPSVQYLPMTVLAGPPTHPQLPRPSCSSQSNIQSSHLPAVGLSKAEVTAMTATDCSWPSTKPSSSEAKDGPTHHLAPTAPVYRHRSTFALAAPLSSPRAPAETLSTKTDVSLPLSKEIAAAAMVSLSAMNAFSESSEIMAKTSAQNFTPPNSHILSQSSSTFSTPQFLIPSSDRTKLIISPAGIEHLQLLLRKQGISEGYFIITSPRVPSLHADVKSCSNEISGETSSTLSNGGSKKDNSVSKDITQNPMSTSSDYSTNSVSMSSFVSTFGSESVSNNIIKDDNSDGCVHGLASKDDNNDDCVRGLARKDDNNDDRVHGLASKDDCLDMETDESENENSSSSDSRSSSTALVIETGEEDERMETDRSCSEPSPKEEGDAMARGNVLSSESHDIIKIASDESTTSDHNHPKLTQDNTSWETESTRSDDARQCIPQSPLSLSDLIRQQQNRPGFSRQLEYSFLTSPENKVKDVMRKTDSESPRLPSSESHDFQFPMPVCPASSFSTTNQHHQHVGGDIQAGFQHNMFASDPSFSTDLTFDSSVHHPAMEARMNHSLEDVVSSSSPKLISNTFNSPSPKSPLSVNSSQALDQNVPLNPPMTPNTMLINLLNRVPTPFLTNPQDLLSAPASQENVAQETDAAGDFEMVSNKTNDGIYSGKNLDFTSGQTHTQLDTSEEAGQSLLYSENSRNLPSNTGSYVAAQNALELIASNYPPRSTRNNVLTHEISSQLPSSFRMIGSKSFDHSSYTHCNMAGENQSLNFSENFQEGSESHNVCNSFHCKSCSGPLLVTVNLEPESLKYVTSVPSRKGKVQESILGPYEHTGVFDQTLSLQEHSCDGGRSADTSRMIPEKSRETDILRHLILNTSTSSLHTLQPVQNLRNQQYSNPSSTFNLSQSHHSQDSQFECRVESFLEPENQHKTLSGPVINQSNTFSAEDESFLHISHVHAQPSPSYDNSNTSFQTPAHPSYENTVSSSFDNRNNSSIGNQPNASYIIPANMSSDTSFSVQDMTKSSMSMSHDFMESDNRLQHLAPFRSANHQNELFYQHTDQPDIHQHHYDPSNQHQGLHYHLDSLPSSHQPHQYSTTSLTHPDSTRMFSDHTGNVEYMNSQYQSQFYDSGGVASTLPLFTQQCVVGSEAPVIGNTANHPCNIPFSSAPREHQLEFRFPSDDVDDGNNIEKQPVLPSASFSPPSVADQAATPEPGGMSMYHGSFPNLSMYDMYMRGSGDARGAATDAVQESGNFCVECNIMYKAQCKFHSCDYVYVSDTSILSHARLTLPSCLRLGTSSVLGHTNNTGVYAKDKIAVRTKFGPLIGSPVSCDKLSSTRSFSLWQTFLETSIKVMDTSDENSSNWLMFVKPARVSLEQNLVAFQHGSSVYFVTRSDIEPDQELLYWFAKDYSNMLGITSKSKSAQHQLCPHCPVCKHVFPDRKQVHSHVRLQHPKPCTKKCSHCSRRFSQVSHLNTHITSVHLRVKKFICAQCGKRFSDSSNFRKHVKSHSDERLFKCLICGKDFRQKAHLKLHMNTHMPVKNEQCGFCGERFTRAFTRRQHELQHTKQNKISCVHCDKVFYKQQIYKQHLKIHSNERKYVCSHCSKAFRTKANLSRHGPSCKQQKCGVMPHPPPPPIGASQIQAGNFLHSSHSEVSLSAYSNDASTSSESV